MLRELLKSKIHRCTITEANVEYVGSITIDEDLLDAVDMWQGELVHVWNIDNGERFQTYALAGPRGSGVICINGAAALKVSVGQKVIVASFGLSETPIEPKVILTDEKNRIEKWL
jgi:aspartate 1-decarboxylase